MYPSVNCPFFHRSVTFDSVPDFAYGSDIPEILLDYLLCLYSVRRSVNGSMTPDSVSDVCARVGYTGGFPGLRRQVQAGLPHHRPRYLYQRKLPGEVQYDTIRFLIYSLSFSLAYERLTYYILTQKYVKDCKPKREFNISDLVSFINEKYPERFQ